MADLIDRQATIDALDSLCDRMCPYSKKQRAAMCGACALGSAFDVIEELPSADMTELETLRQKVKAQEQAMLRVVMQLADKIQTEDTE